MKVYRVSGLHLTHTVTDDGVTMCGENAERVWPASGDATCVLCKVRPLLEKGELNAAQTIVMLLPHSKDTALMSNVTSALSEIVAAKLREV